MNANPRRLHRANQQSRASLGPNETDETSRIGQEAAHGPLHPERKTQPDPFRGNDHNYVFQVIKLRRCAEQGPEMGFVPKEWLRNSSPPTIQNTK